MNFDKKLALAIIIVVASVAGIVYIFTSAPIEVSDSSRAASLCALICKAALNEGRNLDNGPCLSSVYTSWEVRDWVCDVAHWPREEADNLPENQCPEYGATASHFVEVDPQCVFIRAV